MWFNINWLMILPGLLWLSVLEYFQVKRYGWKVYLFDFWNIVSTVQTILVITIYIIEYVHYRGIALAILPSISTFLLLIQLSYWTQMFYPAAMYSYIIGESVKGTSVFMLMCLLVIVSFGCSIYVLD